MTIKRLKTVLLAMLFMPFALFSQRYISGRITDAADGNPIPAATIFFTNTTVGMTTDIEGNYRLRIPGEGSYQLTVSHVGYQSVVTDIEPGNASVKFDAALQPNELEEFTVATRVRFRQTDINLFYRTLFGKKPSRRTIQATNPQAVYYYYNPETKILKVTCREPLQIVNYETGYHIQCVLGHFTHDYNTGVSDWSHQCVFTELEPANLRQKNSWTAKREEIYRVSLTKFIRSLYNNSLHNDGFVLADLRLNPDSSTPFSLFSLTQEAILSTITADKGKTLDLSDRNVLLFCYGRPVTGDDLEMLARSLQANEQLEDNFAVKGDYVMEIRSIQASAQARYREGYFSYVDGGGIGVDPQASTQLDEFGLYRNLLQGESIRIFPDGTYANRLRMIPVNSSETLLGLSISLPLEYLPKGSMPLGMAAEAIADNDQHQSANTFAGIDMLFEEQLNLFPQEKIHLHTDRDAYVPGEKIWFKAYVVDANTHLYPVNSRYVYVELISPADTVVNRVMITATGDLFYGHLPLTEMIPEGNYTLRAYTRYMENLGDDYFFKKNIRIENLSSVKNQQQQTAERLINPSARKDREDFDVSFFPEGGNLPEGVLWKIAFKALNRQGYPVQITGSLIDETGAEIKSVQTWHAGMGVFNFLPEKGKRYSLKCTDGSGTEKQFELPQSVSRAYSLAVASTHSKGIVVGVEKSVNAPDIPCYLLVHCRGSVLYFAEWDNRTQAVSLSEDQLPAGVIQVVLFDGQMNPLSERLIFSNNSVSAEVEFQTDRETYPVRDRIVASLSLSDSSLYWRNGHFSIAVTDDSDIAVDETTTILSSLLLSSELRGHIENPAYYFHDPVAMDLLMMTHGWRRYNVPEVVQGRIESPLLPFQQSQRISGQVTTLNLNRPVSESEILIMANDGGYEMASTDENGFFIFDELAFPDSTLFYVQALTGRGRDNVRLTVEEELFPKPVYVPQDTLSAIPAIALEAKDKPSPEAFMEKAEQRAKYDEDIRTIYLPEVEITVQRIKKESRDEFWVNKLSFHTLPREIIEAYRFINIRDYFMMLPPPCSGIGCPPPLYLIDGVEILGATGGGALGENNTSAVDEILATLHYDIIASIDVISGSGASIFGARGAGGAYSITLKKDFEDAQSETFNKTVYAPLGYQKPVEFYSPKYETLEARHWTIPDYRTTIFWKPDLIITDEEREATFEFYTSDFPTTYSVVIEGLTTDGRMIRQVEKIQVK